MVAGAAEAAPDFGFLFFGLWGDEIGREVFEVGQRLLRDRFEKLGLSDGAEGFREIAHDEADEVLRLFAGAFAFVRFQAGGLGGGFGPGGVGGGFLAEGFLFEVSLTQKSGDEGEEGCDESSGEDGAILFLFPCRTHELLFGST